MPRVPLIDPIPDHTGAHGSQIYRSQRNLADDMLMIIDGEHHSAAGLLVVTHLLHPLVVGHRRAVHGIA